MTVSTPGMQAKSKSIKRRRTETADTITALEDMISTVNILLDIIKRLMSCTTAGSELYTLVGEFTESFAAEHQPSEAVWERCLRAIAFEDWV